VDKKQPELHITKKELCLYLMFFFPPSGWIYMGVCSAISPCALLIPIFTQLQPHAQLFFFGPKRNADDGSKMIKPAMEMSARF